MTTRRLLVISHGFPPYYGGAEHAAGFLAAAAAASGRWQVDVLTSDIGGRLPAQEDWHGVGITRVPTRKKEWTRHSVPELLSFLRSAVRAKGVARPDYILAHFTVPAGEVARQLAGRFGVPYAVVLHGSDVPGYQNARFGLVYPVLKPMVRRVWRNAAHVFAVSDPLRELALKTWRDGTIKVIANGVETELFQPLEKSNHEDSHDWKTLIVTAQLIERKGIQHLIAAIAALPPTLRSKVRLRICGRGPYEQELRSLAGQTGLGQQVEFAGLIPHGQLPGLLNAADIYVLPALQEGLPLALLEAMACGLPVIATAVGGIPDVIRDGTNGLLVPPGSASALTRALEHLLTDDAARSNMGSAARETMLSWSWRSIWDRYDAQLV